MLEEYMSFLLVATTLLLIVCYFNYKNKYFQRRGLNSVTNPLPVFGHMFNVFLGKEHLLLTIYRAYKSRPDDKFFGFYAFNKPVIVLKDLDVIKNVTVKDFDHFLDHKVFFDEEDEPLFGRNLFFLRGQKWRDMRIAMSPAYTASKMKNMLPFVTECAENTILYFKEELAKMQKEELLEVEMKDVFTRFTNDVIASTAFGIQVNSFKEKQNDFYIMGKCATNFSGVQFLKFFGYSSCPRLMKLFGIPLFPVRVKAFFRKIVKDAITNREKTNHLRPDMIHLLMLAKKGSLTYDNVDDGDSADYKESANKNEAVAKREWTHDDLTAQAVAFLLAGFDTSSTLLCFTAYELARHPVIQQRLQEEIDALNITAGNKLTYAVLNSMKYMDMVVSESLRMWPPDSLLERVCTKPYMMPPQNDYTNVRYKLNVGDDIMIPTYSIHHDPKNHPNPEEFNPERFSEENKPFMLPFSFIPFGVGPRTCIGARFAVMEAKVMLFYLLTTFDITVTQSTAIPIKLATDTFTLHSVNGFRLGLRLRAA